MTKAQIQSAIEKVSPSFFEWPMEKNIKFRIPTTFLCIQVANLRRCTTTKAISSFFRC